MTRKIIMYGLVLVFVFSSVNGAKISYNYQICGDSSSKLNKIKECNIYQVETIDKNNLQLGDIVCFNYYKKDYKVSSSRYICHELIYYDDTHFCTYSDTYNYYDNCMEWKNAALKVII